MNGGQLTLKPVRSRLSTHSFAPSTISPWIHSAVQDKLRSMYAGLNSHLK